VERNKDKEKNIK
jgi:hypothetical protein